MSGVSVARGALDRARFFAEQAEAFHRQEQPSHRNYCLEASIVFGRSAVDQLKREHESHPRWREWFATLLDDPLLEFFREQRHLILKEGPLSITTMLFVSGEARINFEVRVRARVKRGHPWYRRSPRIWWEDVRRPVLEHVLDWRAKRRRRQESERRRREHEAAARSRVPAPPVVQFADSMWESRSAFDVLHEYFDKLQKVVEDAESQFGS